MEEKDTTPSLPPAFDSEAAGENEVNLSSPPNAGPFLDKVRLIGASNDASTLRVLFMDGAVPEEQTLWLATTAWHVVVSFGDNLPFREELASTIEVEVLEKPGDVSGHQAKQHPASDTLVRVCEGRLCLWMDVCGLAKGRTGSSVNTLVRRLREQSSLSVCTPIAFVGVFTSPLVGDGASSRDAIKMIFERAPEIGQGDVVIFRSTHAFLSRIRDVLGRDSPKSLGKLLTKKQIAALEGLVSIVLQPEAVNSRQELQELQIDFLSGGLLTIQQLALERALNVQSSLVPREASPEFAHKLRLALSESRLASAPRDVVLTHSPVTGGTTIVRSECFKLVLDDSAVVVEVMVAITSSPRAKDALLTLYAWANSQEKQLVLLPRGGVDLQDLVRTFLPDKPVVVAVARAAGEESKKRLMGLRTDLSSTLSESECRMFQEVYQLVDGQLQQEGRDTVFLWGCGRFALAFTPLLSYVKHHADQLDDKAAACLRVVAAISWFAGSVSDVLISADVLNVLLSRLPESPWPNIKREHKHLCALLRMDPRLGVTAPIRDSSVCAILASAATQKLVNGSVAIDELVLDWATQVDAVRDSVKSWIEAASFAGFDSPSVNKINNSLFIQHESSRLLQYLPLATVSPLFDLVVAVPCRSQPHYLGHRGLYLAAHGRFDAAKESAAQALRIAERNFKDQPQLLSTLQTMHGTILSGRLGHYMKATSVDISKAGEFFLEQYDAGLSAFEKGIHRARDRGLNGHALVGAIKMLTSIVKHAYRQQSDLMRPRDVFSNKVGEQVLADSVEWLERLELAIEESDVNDEEFNYSEFLAQSKGFLFVKLGLQQTPESIRRELSKPHPSSRVLSMAATIRSCPWAEEKEHILALIFLALRRFLQMDTNTGSWFHSRALILSVVHGGGDKACRVLDLCQVIRRPPSSCATLHAQALWERWSCAALLSSGQSRLQFSLRDFPPRLAGVYFPRWFVNDSGMISGISADSSRLEPRCGQLDGKRCVEVLISAESFMVSCENLPSHISLAPSGYCIYYHLAIENYQSGVRLIAVFESKHEED